MLFDPNKEILRFDDLKKLGIVKQSRHPLSLDSRRRLPARHVARREHARMDSRIKRILAG
jgi:hypothetical protein